MLWFSFIYLMYIIVASQECYAISNHRQFICLSKEKNSEVKHDWLYVRGIHSLIFPSQRVSNAERVSLLWLLPIQCQAIISILFGILSRVSWFERHFIVWWPNIHTFMATNLFCSGQWRVKTVKCLAVPKPIVGINIFAAEDKNVCVLTYCGLVTPYDIRDLGQYWLR